MIKRTVATDTIYKKPKSLDAILEGRYEFIEHFARTPNRLEMNLDSLNSLLRDRFYMSKNPIEELENITGCELVIDQTLKNEEIKIVHEWKEGKNHETI